jgi:hypothetical protein
MKQKPVNNAAAILNAGQAASHSASVLALHCRMRKEFFLADNIMTVSAATVLIK